MKREANTTTVLLDTSVQIDRRKMRSRSDRIDEALGKFGRSIATTVGLLEFKATFIRQLVIIHDQLRLKRRFTAARDALLEKQHRQSQLRAHIFNNLLAVSASSFEEMTPERDQRLAEESCLRIENHIREAYRWFRFKSTDAMASAVNCTRAAEYPEKKRVRYLRIPRCKRGENMLPIDIAC